VAPTGVPTGTDPNPKGRHTLLLIDGSTEAVLAVGGAYYTSFAITIAR